MLIILQRPYEEWTVQDWPETYQNPSYKNIFAPGIAFAPPHTISKPRKVKTEPKFSQHHQEQVCHQELQQN